ncbi:MAG: hypothetical protein FK731_03105 [Asgard group archaeon]|nr:hypothetical protein [Asgard group archaeon]
MRKILSLLFILYLLCGTLIIFVSADDDFAIVDGQSFVYDFITSKIDVTVKHNDFSVDTFHIAGNQFSIEKSIKITVTHVELESLNYSITCEDITFNTSLYTFDNYFRILTSEFFYRFSFESLTISNSFQDSLSRFGTLTKTIYSKGFPVNYNIYFFIPPKESTWEFLQEISQNQKTDPINPIYPSTRQYLDLVLNSSYEESNGLAILENYIQASVESDFYKGTINNGCKYAYNITTGVLYGFRSKSYFAGNINDDRVHCESEFHIELSGFDLSDFSFYSEIEYIDRVRIAIIFIGIFTSVLIIPLIVIAFRKWKII